MAYKTKNDRKVKSYIEAIKACIIKDYGFVPAEWQPQLDQLENYYRIYLQAAEKIKTEELVTFHEGVTKKNPTINVMNDCIVVMDRLIKKFGLSPYDRGHVKKNESAPVTEEEEYLNSL